MGTVLVDVGGKKSRKTKRTKKSKNRKSRKMKGGDADCNINSSLCCLRDGEMVEEMGPLD